MFEAFYCVSADSKVSKTLNLFAHVALLQADHQNTMNVSEKRLQWNDRCSDALPDRQTDI